MIRNTLMALAATAAIATGAVATTTSAAEAKIVIKVKHGGYGPYYGGYGPYYGGYGGYYGGYGGCFVKQKWVPTPWGPVLKNKTVCY